ncbi:MAG TPA: hypothetical protein PLS12_04835 [Bacteroidales bacterium]|nr:hypothetical protein [Bacteroidales bacterium]
MFTNNFFKNTKIYILFPLLIFSTYSFAQIRTGGNIGLNVYNNILIIDLSPEIGYTFIDNALAGFSPFILYAKQLQTDEKQILYGARTFGEYKLEIGAFAHVEYEISRLWTTEGFMKTMYALPVGGGFESPIGINTTAYFMLLYDVLYKPGISYRQNPIIRAGLRYSF